MEKALLRKETQKAKKKNNVQEMRSKTNPDTPPSASSSPRVYSSGPRGSAHPLSLDLEPSRLNLEINLEMLKYKVHVNLEMLKYV